MISKILMVEDNATFRYTLKNLLHCRFPYMSLEEAQNGKEALQKTNDFLPDIIFMDINLQGENGLSLTKKIKDVFPGTIVILLTNYDLLEYRKAAKKSGADYFLTKGSITAEEILDLVDSFSNPMPSNSVGNG